MRTKENSGETLNEVLVNASRVTKVVKGGRNFSFSVCVVKGNKRGKVAFAKGKAKEVSEARMKASLKAEKNLLEIPLKDGRTINHDVSARYRAARVTLRVARPGTGIIAGGHMRAIFECLGIQDIVAKSLGSNNVYAVARATFAALLKTKSPKAIAQKRDKTVAEIFK